MTDTMAALSEIERQIQHLHDLGERIQTAPVHSMRLALHTAREAMIAALGGDHRPETRKKLTSAVRMANAELGLEDQAA